MRKGIVFKMGQKCLLVRSIVDAAEAQKVSISPILLAVASCAAGGDFTPGTNGVTHKFYLRAAWFNAVYIGDIALPGRDVNSEAGLSKLRRFESQVELLTLLAFLQKAGINSFINEEEASCRQSLLLESMNARQSDSKLTKSDYDRELRTWLVSSDDVGGERWRIQARCIIFDRAKSTAEVVPAREFINLQAARINFVVGMMWARSSEKSLVPAEIGGIGETAGYDEEAAAILELPHSVESVLSRMQMHMKSCGCGTSCSSNRCACKAASRPCVGCLCVPTLCSNPYGSKGQVP